MNNRLFYIWLQGLGESESKEMYYPLLSLKGEFLLFYSPQPWSQV